MKGQRLKTGKGSPTRVGRIGQSEPEPQVSFNNIQPVDVCFLKCTTILNTSKFPKLRNCNNVDLQIQTTKGKHAFRATHINKR